jgi:hypothetical protein
MVIAALLGSFAPGLGDSSARYSSDAASYQLQWRLDRLNLVNERISENPLANWVGQGYGAGSEEQWGLEAVTSGILGGDLTVSYLFGGFFGIALLAAFWLQLGRLGAAIPGRQTLVKRGLVAYAVFVAAMSLIEPVITQFALRSEVLTLLLMAFPLLAETQTVP